MLILAAHQTRRTLSRKFVRTRDVGTACVVCPQILHLDRVHRYMNRLLGDSNVELINFIANANVLHHDCKLAKKNSNYQVSI